MRTTLVARTIRQEREPRQATRINLQTIKERETKQMTNKLLVAQVI